MGAIALIATTLFFPLNYLLMFGGEPANGNVFKENTFPFEAEVRGVERSKGEEVFLESILPVATYQPVRNDEAYDIAIPDAHASLVLDSGSGAILHEKNANQRRQVASLTKIMTATLVVENVPDLSDEVVIPREVLRVPGTTIGCPRSGYCIGQRLVEGERISVRSLLEAMLTNSTNDAATALAIHVGGTQENFVNMMNEKAKSMGLSDTNFCTPSGLEIDGKEETCYSTAYDIGKIVSYSLRHDIIWEIFKIPEDTIYSIDGKYQHHIGNTNRLLNEMPSMIGAKTGFTPMAGYSLFMAARDESGKHKIITVVLDDPYRWDDAQEMVEWAYNSFSWQ